MGLDISHPLVMDVTAEVMTRDAVTVRETVNWLMHPDFQEQKARLIMKLRGMGVLNARVLQQGVGAA